MAATTIGALSYRILADTTQFSKGMQLTRSEITLAKKVMHDSKTDAERYGLAVQQLDKFHRVGALSARQHAVALNLLQKEFLETEAAANRAGRAVASGRMGGGALGQAATGVASGLGLGIGGGVAGVVAAGVAGAAAIGKHSVSLAADLEQTTVSFRVMLGSALEARMVLADLRTYAAETPFELPDVTDAATKLVSFRIENEKLMPTLKALGDLSAGLRIPLGELADIYGRQKAQGRLFAQDLNQFTGRGIPLIQELAKQFGVADMEVRKLVEEGKVGFDNLEEAVISLTSEGGQFHNLTKEQSQTLKGLASTMKDEVNAAFTEFGETLANDIDLKGMIRDVTELTKEARVAIPAVSGLLKFWARPGDFFADMLIGADSKKIINDALELDEERRKLLNKKPAAGGDHDPLAQDFAKELVDLERRRDELGKSKLEVEMMRLAQSKYTEEQRKSLEGVLREIDAQEKLLGLQKERTKQQDEAARKLGKFMENLVLDAVKKAEQETKQLQDIAGRVQDKVNPGVKLGQEFFDIQRALDAGLISNEDAKAFSDDLLKEFGGRFRQQAPSRTAGAALERGSAEAFSAIMRAADRGQKNKLEELPPIAKQHLEVAQQTKQLLERGAANPVQVVENNF